MMLILKEVEESGRPAILKKLQLQKEGRDRAEESMGRSSFGRRAKVAQKYVIFISLVASLIK